MTYDKDSIQFQPKPTSPQFKDIEGQTFHRLTALGYVGWSTHSDWLWQCICGTAKVIAANDVVSGNTKSCGCLKTDGLGNTTHGKRRERIYGIWINMKSRCTNPNSPSFQRYGRRRITVCERWLYSFEHFYADMGDPPSPHYSLERRNNQGNYEPANCKWATATEQSNNRRSNHCITIDGQTKTLAEWVRQYNADYRRVWARLHDGWDAYKALTHPKRSSG